MGLKDAVDGLRGDEGLQAGWGWGSATGGKQSKNDLGFDGI